MKTNPVAYNIKQLRSAHHWSQEELALVSGVDVRTIQRAEAGSPLAVETLKALASAFNVSIEFLQVSEDEITAAVEDFKKKYTVVQMMVVNSSGELGDLLQRTDALLLEKVGDLTESQLDEIAQFQEELRDYSDIWRDMGTACRRTAEKSLFDKVTSLKSSDMSASFGVEELPLRLGEGTRFQMSTLYVVITKGPVPMMAIARPKNMKFEFA